MEQQITYLTRLQNIETESKATQLRIEEISKQYEAQDRRLQEFKALMTAESRENDDIRKAYRVDEVKVQDNLNLISKSKAKLAMAKNNKEYQSCLKEIEELEKKNSAIEDGMLEILDRIEAAENKQKQREREYAELKDAVEESCTEINAEIEKKQQELEQLSRSLQSVREKISPELREIFEKAKRLQANQLALARVVDAVCQGCNVTIPAQLYNELHRRDSIRFCPKCGRIVYWSESAG